MLIKIYVPPFFIYLSAEGSLRVLRIAPRSIPCWSFIWEFVRVKLSPN